MSLRDQLLAKGLVSKKRAQQVDRELKHARKAEQSQRKRKHVAETEEARAEAARKAAEVEAREAARQQAAAVRAAHEHRYRVRQIVGHHRMGVRGTAAFHHRVGDTQRIACMRVSDAVVLELRGGRLAIAALQRDDGTWEHHLVSRQGALKLAEVAPESLVHWVTDLSHLNDPSQAPYQRTWETTGHPHRVRDPDELTAWRQR